MKHTLFGLAATAAIAMTLMTGCPAEKSSETTSTTTTTTEGASPVVAASEGSTTTTTTTTTTNSAAPSAAASMAAASPAAAKSTTAAAASVDAKTIFSQKCAGCHGANGGGGMGPNLAQADTKGDAYIRDKIVKGSPTKGMPAFGEMLKANEIDALVAYVKTL